MIEKYPCRETVTKERLYERLNNAIKDCEMTIMRQEAILETLRRTKWNLDEYFEDLDKAESEEYEVVNLGNGLFEKRYKTESEGKE